MDKQLHYDASLFFSQFVDAFATFDGEVVGRLFASPYLAVDADGNSKAYFTAENIAQYFQQHLTNYRADGVEYCEYDELEGRAVDGSNAILTVTWTLRAADGEPVTSWRESYLVGLLNGGMKVYTSIDHSDG